MSDSEDSDLEEKKEIWRNAVEKMRERLKNRLDENVFEGIREDKLYHGLKLASSNTMLGKYAEICYCGETQEYLVIDSPLTMFRYSMQGKPIQPPFMLSSTMSFTRLLWCDKANVLVGYIPHDDLMWVMTSSCVLYQIVRNEFRIEAVFYETSTNELICMGTNKVTRYPLANKEQALLAWKTMSYVDSEYGALWKVEYTSLIPGSTSLLRLAGSYLTTVYVMPLESGKDKEEGVPAPFLARRPGATESAITALLFQITSQWIITGDQLGNVMGWNIELDCMMSCMGGHNGRVRQIASHPSICGFVSCADDNVLIVWSCNLRDKMESFSNEGEIWRIAVNESAAAIATLGVKLSCFNMHQLYVFYAPLTEHATNLLATINPMYPTRVIVSSADNSIRILASGTGKQINLQILPPTLDVVSMAYSGNKDRLYTIILKTGEILVSNSSVNPMNLRFVWINDGPAITCIVAYEYYEEIRGYDLKPQKPRVIYAIRTRIFVGTECGDIVGIEETSGKHECHFPAHNGPVAKLWSSTISHYIVSMGVDKCVKVWRVFPDIALPLALSYSVYFTIPITHVASMGYILCMVSSTLRLRTHQLLMYNMAETLRLDHHPAKDHTKLIVDIAASESLQLCATSSQDNTIRIWDAQNDLLKILEINTCAHKITFSSLRGDIVFSAGRHLYRIGFENYLSPKYRARIAVNDIPEDIEEEPLPEDDEYKVYGTEVNRSLMLHPVSSAPLGSLDMLGGDAPRLDLMIQAQMCAQIERRYQDICSIREGMIKATKLVADKALMNHDVWEKYIEDCLGLSVQAGKEIPPYNVWIMVEKYKEVKRFYNKPGVFRMLYGYSIERFPEFPENLPEPVRHPRMPLFGFLPNSVIYKIFGEEDKEPPPPIPPKKRIIKYDYPIEFLMAQLRQGEPSFTDNDFKITLSQLGGLGEEETEPTVARVSIDDQSPFMKFARRAREEGREVQRGTHKKNKGESNEDGEPLTNLSLLGRRAGRKKVADERSPQRDEIPTTIEEILCGDKGKLHNILSQREMDNQQASQLEWGGRNVGVSRAVISGITFPYRDSSFFNKGSIGLVSKGTMSLEMSHQEELPTQASSQQNEDAGSICATHRCQARQKAFPDKKGNEMMLKKKSPTRVKKSRVIPRRSTNVFMESKTISQRLRGIISETTESIPLNLKEVSQMSINEIIKHFEDIKSTLKTEYGNVSADHDEQIKNCLLKLLTRFINNPTSFSVVLELLDIIKLTDEDIISTLCAAFIVTNITEMRELVMKYLRRKGLRDPQEVLTKQLDLMRNEMGTNNLHEVKEFIQEMISDWVLTLVRHVALVVNELQHGNLDTPITSFLLEEMERLAERKRQDIWERGSVRPKIKYPKNIKRKMFSLTQDLLQVPDHLEDDYIRNTIVSPIEGINYFCELNTRFSKAKRSHSNAHETLVNVGESSHKDSFIKVAKKKCAKNRRRQHSYWRSHKR